MLRSMRAVVTPQTIINNCIIAVQASGLGRSTIMDKPLSFIDHFSFYVHPDEYAGVSEDLQDMLRQGRSFDLPFGYRVTLGLQRQDGEHKSLSWFHGNPLYGLAVASSEEIPLQPGGGFVAFYANLSIAEPWLEQHGVSYEVASIYGNDVLWVPLDTPDYGVGPGYYAMCVVTESIIQTTRRLDQLVTA